MKGAREFAELFQTGQYFNFYIVSGIHARGRTFHIQILPPEVEAQADGFQNLCLNDDAVEVYGVVAGVPGWNEEYGWLYEGPWQRDFELLVRSQKLEREAKLKAERALDVETAEARERRILQLLADYKSMLNPEN